MFFLKINKEKFKEWLMTLPGKGEVYLPTKENKIWTFKIWNNQSWPDNFPNSRIPPKNLFFPSGQALLGWKYGGGSLELNSFNPGEERRIVVGLRPCDLRSFQILKSVFAGEYVDIFYLKNLARTTLIGLACPSPCPGSFCQEMRVDPQDSADNDLFLREIPGGYVAKVITKRGQDLVANNFFTEAAEDDWSAVNRQWPLTNALFDLEEVKIKFNSFFADEEFWQRVSDKCLNCGICTYLCPTCHCFDICDLKAQERGARFRCYDSCAFPNFTKMTVHNPRNEKWRRYRQRVSHKFSFFPQNFQDVACVGCGRCVNFCPVNLDLREVLKAIR